MSRFEQGPVLPTARQILAAKKVKLPEGRGVILLDKTGDSVADIANLNLYTGLGYEQVHEDTRQVGLIAPPDIADYEKHCQDVAESRLVRNRRVGVGMSDERIREDVGYQERMAPMTSEDFLNLSDDD